MGRRDGERKQQGPLTKAESPTAKVPDVYCSSIRMCVRGQGFTKLSYARRSRINYSYEMHQSSLRFLLPPRASYRCGFGSLKSRNDRNDQTRSSVRFKLVQKRGASGVSARETRETKARGKHSRDYATAIALR